MGDKVCVKNPHENKSQEVPFICQAHCTFYLSPHSRPVLAPQVKNRLVQFNLLKFAVKISKKLNRNLLRILAEQKNLFLG